MAINPAMFSSNYTIGSNTTVLSPRVLQAQHVAIGLTRVCKHGAFVSHQAMTDVMSPRNKEQADRL
eukprot:4062641-Amphidinium_carterae.1